MRWRAGAAPSLPADCVWVLVVLVLVLVVVVLVLVLLIVLVVVQGRAGSAPLGAWIEDGVST